MTNITSKDKNFALWAQQTYASKSEAVQYLARSFDPFERAIGTLILKYAGVDIDV